MYTHYTYTCIVPRWLMKIVRSNVEIDGKNKIKKNKKKKCTLVMTIFRISGNVGTE